MTFCCRTRLFLPIAAVALLLLALPAFATEVADQQPDPDTLGDQSKPLKIFILAGQSNMQGYGIISAGKEGDLDHAAAQRIDNCYAVDAIRFRGARVNKQISHWFNNATSYCEIGSYSAKAMIAALRGEAPAAEIVGHVDPDTPNPAARPIKK